MNKKTKIIIAVCTAASVLTAGSITAWCITKDSGKEGIKKLAQYKGLSCEYEEHIVSDKDVEVAIQELLYNISYDEDKHGEDDSELYGIELTDEYVRENLSGYDTADELRQSFRESLEEEYSEKNEKEKAEAVIYKITENSEFYSIPPDRIQEKVTELEQRLDSIAESKGYTDFDDYWGKSDFGMTYEEYRKDELEPLAERFLKSELVVSRIKEKENLSFTEEEREYALRYLKEIYDLTDAQAESFFDEEKELFEKEKVYEYLIEQNDFTPIHIKDETEELLDEIKQY